MTSALGLGRAFLEREEEYKPAKLFTQLYLLCLVSSAEAGGHRLFGATMKVKQGPHFSEQTQIVRAWKGRLKRSGSESKIHIGWNK